MYNDQIFKITKLDAKLNKLKNYLLKLLTIIEKQHQNILLFFQEKKISLVKKTYEKDREINELCQKIINKSIWTIAQNQPFAVDLRKIISYLHIVKDFERVGDHIKMIAFFLIEDPYLEPDLINFFQKLINYLLKIIRLVAEAIEKEIIIETKAIFQIESKINLNFKNAFKTIINYMRESKDRKKIKHFLILINHFKYLERSGDHLINICEAIIYIISSEFLDLSKES
jgi:phosphate transport system protein